MDAQERAVVAAYRARLRGEPRVVASAPGRINLIGEHTDYNGGFVLPCAIDRRIAIALGPGEGGLYSVDYAEARPCDDKDDSWADYPRGVAWSLSDAGFSVPPFQAAIAGDV